MATKAFVLIETAVGTTKNITAILQKIEGIKSIDAVTGPYDIIAVVEEVDLNAVGKLVTAKIHPIDGVKRTVTCLSIRLV